jgi:carbamoyltransferase
MCLPSGAHSTTSAHRGFRAPSLAASGAPVLIVGINAYHGDASAAAVVDGRLVAAAEEERFTRVKHCAGFPGHAVRYVCSAAGVSAADLRHVAVARDPRARFWKKAAYAMRMPGRVLDRLRVHERFGDIADDTARALESATHGIAVHRVEHHAAHLASAFFPSPFAQAAVFSVDGLGDFASAMWGVGRDSRLYPAGAVSFPHSLGIFYTAITQYLGFLAYGDEYKVMGLASYGQPEFLDEFRRIVMPSDDERLGFVLGLDYFTHQRGGVAMTWNTGAPTIGRLYADQLIRRLGPPRDPAESVAERHRNLAASLQCRLEEVVLEQLARLHRQTGLRRLCLAGGVAFNCVANGKIFERTGFEEVYVQSAAGDAGLAIGAALYVWHQQLGKPREFVMEHSYWGPEFGDPQVGDALAARRAEIEHEGCAVRMVDDRDHLCRWTAEQIAIGKVVGWFQGRMEWGPRALGNRSILADPRRSEMRDILNTKIKRREMFRPFAPSIAAEAIGEYFEQSHPSPFMLMAYRVRPGKRETIPATTHVDGTGRVQTVTEAQNPVYYRLLKAFERQTGVPVLLNTSFNENEPVVCTPAQALDCFVRTKMDVLVCGRYVIERQTAMGRKGGSP